MNRMGFLIIISIVGAALAVLVIAWNAGLFGFAGGPGAALSPGQKVVGIAPEALRGFELRGPGLRLMARRKDAASFDMTVERSSGTATQRCAAPAALSGLATAMTELRVERSLSRRQYERAYQGDFWELVLQGADERESASFTFRRSTDKRLLAVRHGRLFFVPNTDPAMLDQLADACSALLAAS
jgi:hypothetical protein